MDTATNVNDVTQAKAQFHGEESDMLVNTGYHDVVKSQEMQDISAN
ncbi:MAG: hypothetical protein KDE31_02430 [Caldilineaceae bacterium]|nr:hypothetical protein [Caldilineaceae bacterium]